MKRLNIAMLGEQAQHVIEQTEPVQSSIEVLGSQVEDDLLQAQQTQSQIDAMDGAVVDAQQAQEDLEQEQQAAEQATQLPKEQQQAALESIQRNVKSILKTIGLCNAPGFGMESISSNTTIALEMTAQDIKAFVKKIWDKIVEVWNRTVDVIKDFLNKIFSGAERLKKRAEQIKEAVKNISGKTVPAEKEFDAPASVKNYMRLGYKPIPAATVAVGLEGQNKLNFEIIHSLTGREAVRHYERTIETYTEKLLNNLVDDTVESVDEISKAYNVVIQPVLNLFPQEKGDLYGTHAFISDRVITINKKTAAIDVSEIDGFEELKDKHDVLVPTEMSRIADVVIRQMQNYKNADNAFSDFKEFSKTLAKTQENLSKKLLVTSQEYSKVKDITFTSSEVSRLVGKIMQIINVASTKIRMIDMHINKAAIDWCAASIRLYS